MEVRRYEKKKSKPNRKRIFFFSKCRLVHFHKIRAFLFTMPISLVRQDFVCRLLTNSTSPPLSLIPKIALTASLCTPLLSCIHSFPASTSPNAFCLVLDGIISVLKPRHKSLDVCCLDGAAAPYPYARRSITVASNIECCTLLFQQSSEGLDLV